MRLVAPFMSVEGKRCGVAARAGTAGVFFHRHLTTTMTIVLVIKLAILSRYVLNCFLKLEVLRISGKLASIMGALDTVPASADASWRRLIGEVRLFWMRAFMVPASPIYSSCTTNTYI